MSQAAGGQFIEPRKSLGQHWLHEPQILAGIADAADILPTDLVLEIGPGLGTLTAELAKRAKGVTAIELDEKLVAGLQQELQRQAVTNVSVEQADILRYDLSALPPDYKIVANIPYYLTSHLLRILTEVPNKPATTVLLMQKEVAERVCAKPGAMSILAVAVQLSYDASLGEVVPARMFTPPPKVDSQVLILRRNNTYAGMDIKPLMRLVRIGFAAKRKTLSNTISSGFHISKQDADAYLDSAGIDPSCRAEALSLDQWLRLFAVLSPANLV